MVSKIKVIEIVEFFFLIIKTSNAEAGSQLLCIVNMTNRSQELFIMSGNPGGGGLLPYKGLMGTCGQPGYVFRDFCLNQGIDFINFFLKLHCLQSAFSLKIRPDETKKESLCTDVPRPFLLGLTPSFLATGGLAARVQ